MQAGKYLFLDIGSAETKIVEANVKAHNITILKSAEMRDMSLSVSESGVIRAVEGFCMSLKKTLADAGITTTNAIVCSSILDITNREITSEFHNDKECSTKFEEAYGRSTDFSKINDWQSMGEIVYEKSIDNRLYMSTGRLIILKSFIEAMRTIVGINVIELESSFTAQVNIQSLFAATFDLPSIALFDLGNKKVHSQYFKHGTFIANQDFSSDILDIGNILSKKFDVPYPKMMNLLYNIGVVDDSAMRSKLATAGIEPDSYYTAVNELLATLITDFQKQIASVATTKKLENIQLILTGGISAMPGLVDALKKAYTFTPCSILTIDSTYVTKHMKIVNKLNRQLSAKYANCIGMMLKVGIAAHTVNLVPKELMVIDAGRVANVSMLAINVIAISVATFLAALTAFPVYQWINDKDIPGQYDDALLANASANASVKQLSEYISNIDSINNSLTPFMHFLNGCQNNDLTIATVDTANILDATVTITTDKEKDLTEPEEKSESLINPLEHVIIRGYATNSNSITKFYSELAGNSSVSSVNMNGIREIELSADEIIYIYEVEVGVAYHD